MIAAEVLEHIPADETAMAELARVLKPGGTMAVTVPAWLAEQVCWALSDEYHAPFVAGGHVRIYTEPELRAKLRGGGAPARRRAPRARAARAVLVAEVRGRADRRRPPVGARLPPGPAVGHRRTRSRMATFTKLAERLAQPRSSARPSSSTPASPQRAAI